jgi:UDP-N-acetylmuramoylalanine--D-glutamate ligase
MTDHLQPFERFRGKRGLVMGLGVFGGGIESAKFLARYCKSVVATDLRDEATLADSVAALAGLPVEFRLGEHREQDFIDADVVIHSPAVRPDNRLLELAREHGAEVTMEMSLFIEACPARTIGVTGSNGKSTTTLLCYEMLCEIMQRAQPELAGRWAAPPAEPPTDGPRVWLGGNIGQPLLNRLPEIAAEDWVVLELSSFQLHDWHRIRRSCNIAAITNITPNHLDWHEDFDEYVKAKCAIFDYQDKDGVVLLNAADDVCAQLVEFVSERAVPFLVSRQNRLAPGYAPGLVATSNTVHFPNRKRFRMRAPRDASMLPAREDLPLPGDFNWENAVIAIGLTALARRRLVGVDDMTRAMRRFRGVEHRLEFCGTVNGGRCYNDSIATTPESTIAALSAFDDGVHLILGGSEKGLDYSELARHIAGHPGIHGVYVHGPSGEGILDALADADPDMELTTFESFEEACNQALSNLQPGNVLLMSPASASFYEYAPGKRFTNFEHRGQHFKQLVQAKTGY